jgi:hypothetical protein
MFVGFLTVGLLVSTETLRAELAGYALVAGM